MLPPLHVSISESDGSARTVAYLVFGVVGEGPDVAVEVRDKRGVLVLTRFQERCCCFLAVADGLNLSAQALPRESIDRDQRGRRVFYCVSDLTRQSDTPVVEAGRRSTRPDAILAADCPSQRASVISRCRLSQAMRNFG